MRPYSLLFVSAMALSPICAMAVDFEFKKTSDAPGGRLYSLTFEEVDKDPGCKLQSVSMRIVSIKKSRSGDISGIVGRDPSGIVGRGADGIKGKDSNGNSTASFEPLDVNSLPNVAHQWLPAVFKVGNAVVLRYNVCGTGGFSSLQTLSFP